MISGRVYIEHPCWRTDVVSGKGTRCDEGGDVSVLPHHIQVFNNNERPAA